MGRTGLRRRPKDGASIHIIPVILDCRLPFARNGTDIHSVLMIPLGIGTVLDHLARRVGRYGDGNIIVIPDRAFDGQYDNRLQEILPGDVEILPAGSFEHFLSSSETSDYLLIIDARYWVMGADHLSELTRRGRTYKGATHAVAIGSDPEQVRERVVCDLEGRVQRVRRLYNRMNWPETSSGTVISMLSPASAVCAAPSGGLADLRSALIAKGVFSQDIPVFSDLHDLTNETTVLDLNERSIAEAVHRPTPSGFYRHAPEVLVEKGCRIHPSAKLVGPVIIRKGVTLEERAVVIGPALIGEGSRIGRDSVITRSVLESGALTAPHAALSHCVILDHGKSPWESLAAERQLDGRKNKTNVAHTLIVSPLSDTKTKHRRIHFIAKRAMDLAVTTSLLTLMSPLLLVIALLIKLTSRGPVFFIHRREQKGGCEFPCIKFRTMTANAHRKQRELYRDNDLDGPQFKIAGDPRITRIGHFLRATNLDEVPQLFNILCGHMSLVGPRPSPFRENQICVPWRQARLSVPPGITGLWQLCRDRRHEGDFHQWIYYDITYVREFSFWLDVKILWHTLLSKGGRKQVPLSRLIKMEHE